MQFALLTISDAKFTFDRIRVCEELEKNLTGDYTVLFEEMEENKKAIEELISRTKEADDKNMDQEKLFLQKEQVNEQKS